MMKSLSIFLFYYALVMIFLVPGFLSSSTMAGPTEIVAVKTVKEAEGLYSFDVTIRHKDKGWEHYANKWDVILPSGEVLGTRVLHHPHVNEQPFTRRLSGIKIPHDVKKVYVRAYDNVHGRAKKNFMVELKD
ncbi:MAG: hypothetical protein DHS20C08_09540 [Rhodomicrobium sp.]|nr:MAG: hypothetical protein DHS20C08_09540 [Rhodomicrobium sp.]